MSELRAAMGELREPRELRELRELRRPKTPREPRASGEVAEDLAAPDGLDVPDALDVSDGPDAPDTPDVSDGPDVPDARDVSGGLDVPDASDAPHDPVNPVADARLGAARPSGTGTSLPASRKSPARRGAADPVKALMHRHRALCERAVDPLDIAAGLEAYGLTDRTAARYRHRDVFSLAEELYARVPHDPRDGEARSTERAAPSAPRAYVRWAVLALLPGALGAATVAGVRLTDGQFRLVCATVGTLAVLLGVRAALRRGPLRATAGAARGTRAWTYWLLAYAVLGDGLLTAVLDAGPPGPFPVALAPALALALACAPATVCAHLFAVRARRRLVASRGLTEFADTVRPLIFAVFALFLCALAGLLALCGAVLDEPPAYAGAGALGALVLLVRLLATHGSVRAPVLALRAAGTAEAVALAAVFASRLPGCASLAVPVETVVGAWGPDAVPGLACGLAALALLIHSTRTLTRASAHAAPSEAQRARTASRPTEARPAEPRAVTDPPAPRR